MGALAARLGLDVTATAAGIHRVVNARMADQIRLMTIKRGYDPRRFALVVLGGAGPVHGAALADEMGMAEVLVPEAPGVLAAFGLLAASIEHHHARTLHGRVDDIDLAAANDCLASLDAIGRGADERGGRGRGRGARGLRGRHALRRPGLRAGSPDRRSGGARACRRHRRGVSRGPRARVRLRPPRSAGGVRQLPRASHVPASRARAASGRASRARGSRRAPDAQTGERPAYFAPAGFLATAIFDRARLSVGARLSGPAIIEQPDTTTVDPARLHRRGGDVRQPANPESAMSAGEIDPILLEVLRNRLEAIADEMELTLLKSAASPIVKEGLDASAALFNDRRAKPSPRPPPFPSTSARCSSRPGGWCEAFPPATMRDGDAFLLNDPYDGGTHLPDITLAVPVFAEGRAVALACTMCHHQDVGGRTPGSVPTDATELFQEGLIIPPTQLFRAGVLDENLLGLLRRNVRLPDDVHGRSHGAGRGGAPRRHPPGRAVRAPRERRGAGLHRRAADARRGAHAPRDRGHSRRRLYLRRLARQRRRRRSTGEDPGHGERPGLGDDVRLHGHRPPGARAVQLRAGLDAVGRVLCHPRDVRPHDSEQRRLLPRGRRCPARGEPRQSPASRARELPDGDHQAHRRHDPRRAGEGPAQPHARRELRHPARHGASAAPIRRPGVHSWPASWPRAAWARGPHKDGIDVHRDRCLELHEYPRRVGGDELPAAHPSGPLQRRLGRGRAVSRGTRAGEGLRGDDHRRHGLAPGRALRLFAVGAPRRKTRAEGARLRRFAPTGAGRTSRPSRC